MPPRKDQITDRFNRFDQAEEKAASEIREVSPTPDPDAAPPAPAKVAEKPAPEKKAAPRKPRAKAPAVPPPPSPTPAAPAKERPLRQAGRKPNTDYDRGGRLYCMLPQDLCDRLDAATLAERWKRRPAPTDKSILVEEALLDWLDRNGY